jgi:hypothetical protein
MLNNFMHDFSAAGWLFATILLYVIQTKYSDQIAASKSFAGLANTLLSLTRFCLAGIIIFGIGRVLAYKKYEWNPIAGQGQVTLLIIKHVIFAIVFIAGSICYLKALGIIRKAKNEKEQ